MFMMHISLLFAFSVLLASAILYIWSLRNSGAGIQFAKIISSIIFVLSILSILCISFYGIRYWAQGNFETLLGTPIRAREAISPKMRQEMMLKLRERMEQRKNQEPPAVPAPVPAK